MGRHARRDDAAAPASLHADARLVESLPGWGCFATFVGAVCVSWYGHGWTAVPAVVVLGLGTTIALWCAVRRVERSRRTGRRVAAAKVTMQSRTATCSDDASVRDIGTRRVTP
jgi:hypothetical protein